MGQTDVPSMRDSYALQVESANSEHYAISLDINKKPKHTASALPVTFGSDLSQDIV